MSHLIHNLSFDYHHNPFYYLGEQGPALPETVVLDDSDIETLYVYFFTRGELSKINKYEVIKLSKAFSLPLDYEYYKQDFMWTKYKHDYIRLDQCRWLGVKAFHSISGWYSSVYFDMYRPGGRLVSFNDNEQHAIDIYNQFLEEKANSFAKRIIGGENS